MTFKVTTLTALTLVFSNMAFAHGLNCARQRLAVYTLDTPHWYASANLGMSHLYDKATPGTRDSVNENGPGWNVDAGYQFNSLFGAELGFTQYHDSRETAGRANIAKTEHYVIDVAATGRYPLCNKFNALAKLGLAYGYANKIFTASTAAGSAGSVSLYGGVGVTYSVTPRVDFVLQYAGARGNHLTGSNTLLSLGMTFAIV